RHGLRYHIKDPTSFTPVRGTTKSLLLGSDMKANQAEIGKFSAADAIAYPKYEAMMESIVHSLEPLMDQEPLQLEKDLKFSGMSKLYNLWKTVRPMGAKNALEFYELMTAPISKVMDRWFEGDVLKATLATDGVIGFMAGPHAPGTGYVLLHHVLGGLDGRTGAWAFVYGGMGAVSQAIANAAKEAGAELLVDAEIEKILVDDNVAKGVKLVGGGEIHADVVLSNATPKVTFLDLLEKKTLPTDFYNAVRAIDYNSPVTKINVALKELPNFTALPNQGSQPMPHHQTTVHLNCETIDILHGAYVDAQNGRWSQMPAIEMTIPSSVDKTIAPDGCHVALLFTQYCPYTLKDGTWDEATKNAYAKHVFDHIDAYAPNFSSSVVGFEVLTPPDLEKTFNLTGGNIFHGSMSLDQLYWTRPVKNFANYRTPIKGLYLCGSGAHPGGGVTGAPGRLAALAVLND
uniref:Amine oxidase domain-containing protein n=1 Tax=Plectus sambesii TaxID=2011161 RepID=A0A914XJX4_9BILA